VLKRFWWWFEAGVALLALTIFALACHVMWPDKDGMAAWVQAMGSIVAIAGSAYMVWWQVDKQVRRERDDRIKESRERMLLAQREVANIAFDATQFLVRHAASVRKSSGVSVPTTDEHEYQDLLHRLSWVRERLALEADIDNAISIRELVVEGTFLLRQSNLRGLTTDEGVELYDYQVQLAELLRKLDPLRRAKIDL